jgi:hypothetical protein
MPAQLRKTFRLGAKVVVSAKGGWRRDALGVIVAGPDPIETLQGQDLYWWVEFAVPEHDLDGDGPYYKAQILSRYIKNAS